MTSTLIRNAAAILTGMRGSSSRHPGPDLRISDGVIEALGALEARPGEAVIDATDCVVYPAWVNTHHHLFQSLMKGDPHGIDLPLTGWLAATPYRLRPAFDEELFRLSARIGMIELVRSGCGTIADHNYLYYPHMAFDTSAILFEEAEKLGVRFVLCRGGATQERPFETEIPASLRPEPLDHYLHDIERLAHRYHQDSSIAWRKVVAAPTSLLYSMTPDELRETARTARRLGLRMHSHLSETVAYADTSMSLHGKSPIAFAEDVEWLGSDVWFAHLVQIDRTEIARLGATHTGIAHCPQSNGRLGSGIAPVRELEAAGAAVSIGVDGAASNEAADMISEVHMAWLAQRARGGMLARPRYAGGTSEGGADAATVEDVVRWGTAGGAAVLGLDGVGRIEPGCAADIAVYRLDDPRYLGLHDPAIGPVASGGRPHLHALVIGGKIIVEDDVLAGVDLPQLVRDARSAIRSLNAAG